MEFPVDLLPLLVELELEGYYGKFLQYKISSIALLRLMAAQGPGAFALNMKQVGLNPADTQKLQSAIVNATPVDTKPAEEKAKALPEPVEPEPEPEPEVDPAKVKMPDSPRLLQETDGTTRVLKACYATRRTGGQDHHEYIELDQVVNVVPEPTDPTGTVEAVV